MSAAQAHAQAAASPQASTASDKAVLQSILTKGEHTLKADGKRLRRALVVLRKSIGRNPRPALQALAAMERDTRLEIEKLKAARLHTPTGQRARRLAVRTLVLMDASLIAVRTALAATDRAAAQRALTQAEQHFQQGRRLKGQASRALGFSWTL